MPKTDPFPATVKISIFSDDFPEREHFRDLLLNKSIFLLGGISPRLYNIFFKIRMFCKIKSNVSVYHTEAVTFLTKFVI